MAGNCTRLHTTFLDNVALFRKKDKSETSRKDRFGFDSRLGPSPAYSASFHTEGDAHAAADAQGCQTTSRLATLKFMQERDEYARTRSADRMP